MPTVLVTGATGKQGGSVARHLLDRGGWIVRGLTRNPDSDAARALRQAGAELVQGDLADPESIRRALAGCDAVYGVTNFWEHFEREAEHGRNLVDAVADSGVRDFVLHSLPNVHNRSGGELSVPHFDLKAEVEAYARERVPSAAFFHIAFYYENFLGGLAPQHQDGRWVIGFPQGETSLAGVAAEDVGGIAAVMFDDLDRWRGKVVFAVGDDLPAAAYAAIMGRELRRPLVYQHIPREVFAEFGFPGAEEYANMFDFYRRFVPNRWDELALSRELYPELQTFDTWARRHVDALRAAVDASGQAA